MNVAPTHRTPDTTESSMRIAPAESTTALSSIIMATGVEASAAADDASVSLDHVEVRVAYRVSP